MAERYEISIEVADASFPASSWRHAYGDRLVALALEFGCLEWRWVERSWGVVFELTFRSERAWERWYALPSVRSAFDAVPDPVSGFVVHRGWGGTSGAGTPRRRPPLAGAGSARVEGPIDEESRLVEAVAGALARARRGGVRTAAAR